MYLKSYVKIIVRATRNAQSKGMTFTRYINAFSPGSTIEQVLESGNSTIWFQTIPGDRKSTIQITVTRKWAKTMLHTKPQISRIAFFRKRWASARRPKLWM